MNSIYLFAYSHRKNGMELTRSSIQHDPNLEYLEGHCVYEIVDGSPVGPAHRSIQRVPANENIPLTNTKYWKAFGPSVPDKNKNYLVGCAAIIVNSKNEFLIGRRVDMDGVEVWALFGGKPNFDETLAEGLSREIAEEVNVLIPTWRYLHINMKEALASKTQRCVTAYFLAKLTDFEASGVRNLEPNKCFELKWATFEELHDLNLWQNSIAECRIAYSKLQGTSNGIPHNS